MAEGKRIPRGVPSSESVYLPPHNSPELRSFEDKNGNITRNLWKMEEVVNFVFSKKYQPKYHEIAAAFIRELCGKLSMEGADIGAFLSANGISKATFYNRVLPRLRRVGMVKIERETVVARESLRKYRPMKVSLSRTFGNYFMKIGDSWLACVDDARSSRDGQAKL
jgi:hypothetical protein